LKNHPGSRTIQYLVRIRVLITITITTTTHHVSTTATTTTPRGSISNARPLPTTTILRGTTPHYDRHPAAAGMLLHQQRSRIEVARPQVFSGKMEEVSTFINAARLYIRMKMMEEATTTQVAWVLSYVQGGVAEA